MDEDRYGTCSFSGNRGFRCGAPCLKLPALTSEIRCRLLDWVVEIRGFYRPVGAADAHGSAKYSRKASGLILGKSTENVVLPFMVRSMEENIIQM